jgi:hypothetical protein
METGETSEAERPRPGGPKIRALLEKIELIPTVPVITDPYSERYMFTVF